MTSSTAWLSLELLELYWFYQTSGEEYCSTNARRIEAALSDNSIDS